MLAVVVTPEREQAASNPVRPLQFAALELRFPGDPELETRRGAFFRRVRDDFPLVQVPVSELGQAPALQPYQFATADDRRHLQLALNLFGYSVRGDAYRSFTAFKAEFDRYFGVLAETFPELGGCTRVGLRYVNQLPIERDPAGFLEPSPIRFPRVDGAPIRSGAFGQEVALAGGILRVQIRAGIGEQPGVVILDLDHFYEADVSSPIPVNELDELVERAHAVVRSFFDQSVEPEYRPPVEDA